MGKHFGYIRVSSKGQEIERQLVAIKEQGITEERDIFIDKVSGKDFDREEYQRMKHHLRNGDVLFIHSLDRLGRNKDMILQEWNEITKVIGADIVVLDMPLLDTRQHKDTLGTFVSDLVLQVLSFVAQQERDMIRKRQREGIDLAMKRGVKMGRPKKEIPTNFEEVYARWKAKEITGVQAQKETKLSNVRFYKLVKEYEGSN